MEHTPASNSNQQLSNALELPNKHGFYHQRSVCLHSPCHSSMNSDGVAQVFNEVFGQHCVHHVDMVQRQDHKTGYPFYTPTFTLT